MKRQFVIKKSTIKSETFHNFEVTSTAENFCKQRLLGWRLIERPEDLETEAERVKDTWEQAADKFDQTLTAARSRGGTRVNVDLHPSVPIATEERTRKLVDRPSKQRHDRYESDAVFSIASAVTICIKLSDQL